MLLAWLEKRQKKLEIEKEKYRQEYLDFYFTKVKVNKEFTFLELFDPFSYPRIVRPEDVAKYLTQKETECQIKINYYTKCPTCSQKNQAVEKSHINFLYLACEPCGNSFLVNPDTSFMVFIKL